MDRHGQTIEVAKCPTCNIGDYEFSMVKTDDRTVKSFAEAKASPAIGIPTNFSELYPYAWRDILAIYRSQALGIDGPRQIPRRR